MNTTMKTMTLLLLALAAGCATGSSISDENAERIEQYWRLYKTDDPGWEEAKREWLELGAAEARGLVNLLVQEIQRDAVKTRFGADGKPGPAWIKPAKELASLGAMATPSLLEALRRLKDETVVYPCIMTLAEIAGVEDIEAAFDSGDALYQRRLVRTLHAQDDPKAVKRIVVILNGPYDWQVRATAADVLAGYQGPMESEVIEALQKALDDEDEFVVTMATQALETFKEDTKK